MEISQLNHAIYSVIIKLSIRDLKCGYVKNVFAFRRLWEDEQICSSSPALSYGNYYISGVRK